MSSSSLAAKLLTRRSSSARKLSLVTVGCLAGIGADYSGKWAEQERESSWQMVEGLIGALLRSSGYGRQVALLRSSGYGRQVALLRSSGYGRQVALLR